MGNSHAMKYNGELPCCEVEWGTPMLCSIMWNSHAMKYNGALPCYGVEWYDRVWFVGSTTSCTGGSTGRKVHAEPSALATDSMAIARYSVTRAMDCRLSPRSPWPSQGFCKHFDRVTEAKCLQNPWLSHGLHGLGCKSMAVLAVAMESVSRAKGSA
jgi:hypothetical protein